MNTPGQNSAMGPYPGSGPSSDQPSGDGLESLFGPLANLGPASFQSQQSGYGSGFGLPSSAGSMQAGLDPALAALLGIGSRQVQTQIAAGGSPTASNPSAGRPQPGPFEDGSDRWQFGLGPALEAVLRFAGPTGPASQQVASRDQANAGLPSSDPRTDGQTLYALSQPADESKSSADWRTLPTVGNLAAKRAMSRIGKGDADCGIWMRGNFQGRQMPDGQAHTWPDWFGDHPDQWQEVPNDGKHPLQPGDLIVTDKAQKAHGHVEIIDMKGRRLSASLDDTPGEPRGYWRPGSPVRDLWKARHGTVTIWRPIWKPGNSG